MEDSNQEFPDAREQRFVHSDKVIVKQANGTTVLLAVTGAEGDGYCACACDATPLRGDTHTRLTRNPSAIIAAPLR